MSKKKIQLKKNNFYLQVNSETEEVILSDDEDQNKKEEKNEVKNANPITLISMFFKNTFFF